MPISQERMLALIKAYDELWLDFHQFLSQLQFDLENCRDDSEALQSEVEKTVAGYRIQQNVMVEVERRHFARFGKTNESSRARQRLYRADASGASFNRSTRFEAKEPPTRRVRGDGYELSQEDRDANAQPPQQLDERELLAGEVGEINLEGAEGGEADGE